MSCCPPPALAQNSAFETLNRTCFCLPIDGQEAGKKIASQSDVAGLEAMLSSRPHLFAGTGVFLSPQDLGLIRSQITAIEHAAKLKGFQEAAFRREGRDLEGQQVFTRSVMMGYDFHITPEGPRLIEVNTNAGGAFIVRALARAFGAVSFGCCEVGPAQLGGTLEGPDMDPLAKMFGEEWKRAGRLGKPATLAIIDDMPSEQYLYPDMLLAKEALEAQGIDVFIADPQSLSFEGGRLKHADRQIDMVYNRLTDFQLRDPRYGALRRALWEDAAVISPSPRHHALYADKRNLALLSDQETLKQWGLEEPHLAALSSVPHTQIVGAENADALWAQRKSLFFKPVSGFGSRAVYRGDKMTKRVWAEIVQGSYVAQQLIPATKRGVAVAEGHKALKYDLRAYSYGGEIVLLGARVYQGQTTNFRTEGGGFAPVFVFKP